MKNVALYVALLELIGGCFLVTPAVAKDNSSSVRYVRQINLDSEGLNQPSNLTYSPAFKSFLLLESPSESHRGQPSRIVMFSSFGDETGSFFIPPGIANPIGLALDERAGRLYLLEAKTGDLIEIEIGDEPQAARKFRRFEAWRLGLQSPRDLTIDSSTGELFILDGFPLQIIHFEIDQSQGLEGALHEREIISLALPGEDDSTALRSLSVNPNNGNFYLLHAGNRILYELTRSGQLVDSRDLSSFELNDPQGMAFAPSGDLTDEPWLSNLYLLDGGLVSNDDGQGEIVEFAVAQQSVLASSVQAMDTRQATLIRTILTSEFAPPSPDPAGIAFDTISGNLIIGDSEVDEMSIFTGDNIFFSTLSGTLVRAASSMEFSNEPAGVAFNPVTNRLFISHDSAGQVIEVEPGPDGQFLTADDIRSSFETRSFESFDPEGLACDSRTGAVFVADGVNAEVYRVDPGPNGLFDGLPPAGDDLVTYFDTAGFGLLDPEGIEFNQENESLYVVGENRNLLFVTTTDGQLLQKIDISAANALMPAGVAIGPGSQDPAVTRIYISDRGVDNNADPDENDGKVYEMSLPSLTAGNQPPLVEAGPDQIIVFPASVSLHGAVVDDGVPDQSGVVAIEWSQVSGPGIVTFSDPGALETTASFSEAGTYVLRLSADDGELTGSDDVTIMVTASTDSSFIESRVGLSSDDAEQRPAGNVSLGSSDLELVDDGGIQVVGLRFNNLQLPPAAHITSAYVQFQVDEESSAPTSLTIQGQASDDANTFTTASLGISSRPTTLATVEWEPPAWLTRGEAGPDQRTPELSSVLQEIVNRPNWSMGNSLVLIITGSGKRVAVAYDGIPDGAPLLRVVYDTDFADTTPPQVTAFAVPSSSTSLQVPILAFSATDDVAVSGYLVTESETAPAADDPLWSAEAPASYTVEGAGTHTLYGWARDAAGNLSAALSATVTVTLADITPPQVTAFEVPSSSTSLQVPILAFSATDDVAVSGYLITESETAPAADDPLWSAEAPASYTVSGEGTHILYGWARDAAGNVSSSLSDTVTVTLAVADTQAPEVTAFEVPASFDSFTVPVTTFAASDNVGVSGYLITESETAPAADDPLWSAEAPASYTVSGEGTHTLYGWARDAAGNVSSSLSDTVSVTLPEPGSAVEINVRVTASADDAEERPAGNVSLNSSDLELVYDGGIQTVGLRFNGVSIPHGATILGAYLQFQVDEASSEATSLAIEGQASDNAAIFTNSKRGISSRPRTAAAVPWSPSAWGRVGEAGPDQRTPNIASVVQEIVSRPGWQENNSMAIIISGNGRRVAEAYDGSSAAAPLLHVQYYLGPPDVTPPQVTAFDLPSSSTSLQVPVLAFSATDDVAVSGYLVTESETAPAADDPLWSAEAPASYTVDGEGTHTLYGWARDAAGNVSSSLSDTVSVTLPEPGSEVEINVRVTASADDAEERPAGNVSLNSSDLELVYDGGIQTVGLRFNGVSIPQGATILSAYLQFQVDEASSEATSLAIEGQASDNAAIFTNSKRGISSRPRTAAAVPWSPPEWGSVGDAGPDQRTPNIASVVQEIVSRPGWQENNSMAIIISGTGLRVAEAYDGSSSAAPLLHVQYNEGTTP